MIGFTELKLDTSEVIKQFQEVISSKYIAQVKKELGITKKK